MRQWLPPFDSAQVTTVFETDARLSNLRYPLSGKAVFLTERAGQNAHEFAVLLAEPAKKYTLARYRADDVYGNPGILIPEAGLMPAANPFAEFGVPGRIIRPSTTLILGRSSMDAGEMPRTMTFAAPPVERG